LNAQRRAAARSLPLPNLDPALAMTEPAMPAFAAHGTIPMAAYPGPTAAAATAPREASLPPQPTWRPGPPPAPPASRVLATVAMPEVSLPEERRSTGTPVERSVPVADASKISPARPSAGRRVLQVAGVAGAVLAVGLLAAGW